MVTRFMRTLRSRIRFRPASIELVRIQPTGENCMAKITGIGGVFIKSKGKGSELAEWYQKNLGINPESWGGAILKWTDDKVVDGGMTVWTTADHDSKWFSP